MRRVMAILFASALLVSSLAGPGFAQSFGGNSCVDNCEGHRAGYEWAEENGIQSEDDCSGNSSSFEEGCRTYVEDSDHGAEYDDEGNEIDE
ncbi:hypothetical protein ACCS91_31440 [Rhizobium ruizarguesonis]|uniref:hypothetical protein n=1 Tax=Rhizobium ruizarguesonis TaxID=2081791 RepID=UPI00102F7E6A|nr:hypothetical protein [Rhizobium ruizarguesonis]NKQ87597.1 hypothetical protein [Rhizobium ruizarguesonis]TAW68231.1 hypothetical protein ELI10_32315 [Rhizobium ruizarguesonis]TAX03625.1 hypothetical protein ELI09_29455 [Rhizobium ruizarguesonis]TAX07203.1 hypothetical protein ELI08_32310 [Rhizobium ruizarguesonis]